MTWGAARLDRRTMLLGMGATALAAALAGCSTPFAEVRLRLATGGTQGVYYTLGAALGQAWQDELGLRTPPQILSTAGSVDNLRLLTTGATDVAFSQVDAAADIINTITPGAPFTPCALGRVYDEFVHVVVPAASPVTRLADLRGMRVSLGAQESGVFVIAKRLLEASGLAAADLRSSYLSINDSVTALRDGSIDAFFWTGGVPTVGVDDLARQMPIRLLDLKDVLETLRKTYPVYSPGTVLARSYGIPNAITTVLVRNFLLVDTQMPDDLAYALIKTVFDAQDKLAVVNPIALTIDLRAAIGTQPVPLHPGAERYFREAKDS